MAANGANPYVTLTLKDVNFQDPIPERTVVIKAPDWQVKIGRGTQSGYQGFTPAPDNAWFDSRVMSRSHAILRADPNTKEITVEDVGSMHGTYLDGRRLQAHHVKLIWHGDTLTLGADVTRGTAFFNALNVKVTWAWSDGSSHPDTPRPTYASMYQNTFTADYPSDPEYSSEIELDQEEDDYEMYAMDGHISDGDDDVQVVQDSVRAPSVEIIVPPTRTFTVPESEGSFSREDSLLVPSDEEHEGSPASSPVISGNAAETETGEKTKIVTLSTSALITPEEPTSNLGQLNTSQLKAVIPAEFYEDEEYSEIDNASNVDSLANDEYDELEMEGLDPSGPRYIPPTQEGTSQQLGAGPTGSSQQIGAGITGSSQRIGAGLTSSWVEDQHQEQIRPPSPSDAAMAKPSGEPSRMHESSAPPFPSYPYGPPQFDMTASNAPSTSAWAGHNSVLYDPMPRPLTTYGYQLYYPQPAFYSSTHPSPVVHQTAPMTSSAQPLSPLSIASLVQQPPVTEPPTSQKRKADEMSSDYFESDAASSDVGSVAMEENTHFAATVSPSELNRAVPTALPNQPLPTVKVAEIEPSTDVQPPRKKVKTVESTVVEPRSSGFVKMAAATITGMAIGAVGTIIGLATLPQEYFA